ncbi:HD-GYP domain-containing protein [Pseudalkalibacillus berkeleyi]|uniref:HD-GYP domain-containing protein n=1 Tax=Pseudalkalibacillus berkeleyi TaxID=1069813 RepID=A0ABS9H492_9BACL|nr:HD-GYP domain-containing protein [Pseudalkalibacillus berkeleyi]MCF6138608.1 HD-GYP domain-containing protein [Pseudalkalibacillus berkeleyi]
MNQRELNEGVCLEKNVHSKKGILLLRKGTKVNRAHIDMLKNHDWFFEGEEEQVVLQVNAPKMDTEIETNGYPRIQQSYDQAVHSIREFFDQVLSNLEASVDKVFTQFSNVLEEVLEDEDQAVSLIYEVRDRDEVTYRHSLNVGLISGLIGKILNLPEKDILLLGKMGILHDIGKMHVPDDILKKPSKLTDAEYEEVKLHTRYGFEILSKLPSLNVMVSLGALTHHERLDGTGYPDSRKKEELPFLVQILSIADIYDAICTERSYQKGKSSFIAIDQLVIDANKGRLNEKIVNEFVRYLMKQYVGRSVVLNSGEKGVIAFVPYESPHRPLLKIENDYVDLKKVSSIFITNFAS